MRIYSLPFIVSTLRFLPIALLVCLAGGGLLLSGNALSAAPVSDPNSDQDKACGLNVLMIIDESTSIH